MLAKSFASAMRLFAVAFLFEGCSTDYYTYTGPEIYQGTGGAAKNVDGINIWLVGTLLRKFKIIGYITDSRPGGPIPMAMRNSDLATVAKKNGGDGILIKGDQANFLGTYSTGNAMAFSNGNLTTATGSSVSMPMIRQEGQYFVIKYLN
jgi:hypothetical protein